MQGFVRGLDLDGDGFVSKQEVPERMHGMLDRMAERAGVSSEGRIKVDSLIGSQSNRDDNSKQGDPLAFGEAIEEKKAPGFDVPLSGDAGTSGFIPATPAELEGARDSADSLMKKYDTNGNGILDKDEWAKISGNPANADVNRDGKISRTEMINRLIVMRRSREGTGDNNRGDNKPESSSRDGRRAGAATNRDGSRLSYRFAAAIERIPEKARDWITKYDKDGDGQVAMHEYSGSWSDSRVREFGGYDANGDGTITAEEYLTKK